MSETQKQRTFVNEPMRDKPVDSVPGIGPTLGARLKERGIDKAYSLFGQFLIHDKNEKKFSDGLKNSVNANNKQCKECFEALKTWCDNYC